MIILEEGNMNAESNMTEDLKREAETAACEGGNLRNRAKQLTLDALKDGKLSLEEIRNIGQAITEGVSLGLTKGGGELKSGLKEAVGGMDEAIGQAAQRVSMTFREAIERGKDFNETELKSSIERMRDLERDFLESLKDVAGKSGGKLKEELTEISGHLGRAGTDTGGRVKESLNGLYAALNAQAGSTSSTIKDAARTTSARLADLASGVLAGLSEAMKNKSEDRANSDKQAN
jgi:gas vesicle protein